MRYSMHNRVLRQEPIYIKAALEATKLQDTSKARGEQIFNGSNGCTAANA